MARILVVDDDDAVRGVLKLTLRREGREILEASNGVQALEVIRQQRANLVLLDVEMPGMNGLVFCTHLRSDPSLCDIPVIMMTGRPVDGVEDKAGAAGAAEFIHKPFERLALLQMVKGRLEAPRE